MQVKPFLVFIFLPAIGLVLKWLRSSNTYRLRYFIAEVELYFSIALLGQLIT